MTLQQLKYAVEIADRGSITEAAKALFTSQPSLSAAVRELEEETSLTLFLRGSRGVRVTPEGEEFLGYARQVVQQAALIEDRYVTRSRPKQRFSVSAQHSDTAFDIHRSIVRISNAVQLIDPAKDLAVRKGDHLIVAPCFFDRQRQLPATVAKPGAVNFIDELLTG